MHILCQFQNFYLAQTWFYKLQEFWFCIKVLQNVLINACICDDYHNYHTILIQLALFKVSWKMHKKTWECIYINQFKSAQGSIVKNVMGLRKRHHHSQLLNALKVPSVIDVISKNVYSFYNKAFTTKSPVQEIQSL